MEISDVSMHGLPQNPEFCFQAVMSISGNSDFFFFPQSKIIFILNEMLIWARAWAACGGLKNVLASTKCIQLYPQSVLAAVPLLRSSGKGKKTGRAGGKDSSG